MNGEVGVGGGQLEFIEGIFRCLAGEVEDGQESWEVGDEVFGGD